MSKKKEGDRIAKVVGGQFVSVLTEVEILAKCEVNSGRWYCITHQMRFDNQLQKDGHISKGGHLLAWECFGHGLEEP
jgi:hypothetical protein